MIYPLEFPEYQKQRLSKGKMGMGKMVKMSNKNYRYVVIPSKCPVTGQWIMGISKGKHLDIALYRDNYAARRAAR